MLVAAAIIFVVITAGALAWAREAPHRREMRRKRALRQSVLSWRGRR